VLHTICDKLFQEKSSEESPPTILKLLRKSQVLWGIAHDGFITGVAGNFIFPAGIETSVLSYDGTSISAGASLKDA